MFYNSEKNWYVLRVRSKSEKIAQISLNHKQFDVLNPTYQVLSIRKDRKKILQRPIFVGYIFIHTSLSPELHLEILKTPGVVEILKNDKGPSIVPYEQIQNVLLLEKHVGECFFCNNFEIGDSVFIREGPLTGLRGLIDRKDNKKLYIYIDTIPGSIMVKVEPHQVQLEKDFLYSMVTRS